MRRAYRASILHCLRDPGEVADAAAIEYFDDGVLVLDGAHVAEAGPAERLLPQLGDDIPICDYSGKLLLPGFVDCHVHFPQIDIIASYGEQLLDWLERYAYPAEMRFADIAVAQEVAEFFLDALLASGTTTALVFTTVHKHSSEALFRSAAKRGMRLIAGKVLMDSNCPETLRDTPESGYTDSKALIEKWHGHDRLGYAITPRFALTSSTAQLDAAGKLAGEHPDVWVHTHLAENLDEIEAVAAVHPLRQNYVDVYHYHGLLRERAVFAHCVHMEQDDWRALATAGAASAFCPSSNLFLGSGLFDLAAADAAGARCGLGSDVGAGTSLSLLRTAGDAYKVLGLRGQSLPPARALYLATLGAARALYLDDKIGNFAAGKEADFVVIDTSASALMARRATAVDPLDTLFALTMLADERHIVATSVGGVERAVRLPQ